MDVIRYYEIVLSTYHGAAIGRLRFERNSQIEESALYTIPELNGILSAWRAGSLCGSFAIGSQLEVNAGFQLVNK